VALGERNLILINFLKDDKYYYRDFKEHMFIVRCASITSKMADIHIKNIEGFILSACEKKDPKKTGYINSQELQEALLDNEFLTLSISEIAVIIGQANPKGDSKINYKEFAAAATKTITEYYSSDAKHAKATAVYNGMFEKKDIDSSLIYDEFKLFGVCVDRESQFVVV